MATKKIYLTNLKKKRFCNVLGREYIGSKKIRTIGQAVRPVEALKTDRQTDKQTAVTNILFENRRFRKVTNKRSQTYKQTDRGDQLLFENRRFRKVIIGAINNRVF